MDSDDAIPFALRLKGPRASQGDLEEAAMAALRQEARHEELVEELLARLDRTSEPGARAALLVEIASVLEHGLGDRAQAFDALLEAWRADPTCDAVIGPLEAFARSSSRWPEVFAATEALVAAERDPRRALALCEMMVRWLTQEVPARELAMHYLDRVKQLDPTHFALHLYQAALYAEHGDPKRELEELDRAVLSARRADDRARIHLLMAARYVEERTLNLAEAKKHLRAVLARGGRSMAALRGLEAICVREEDYATLADVLEKQAEATEDETERVAILLRVAEIYEERFLKPDLAAERLERAFVLAPLNVVALSSLERCYRATRAWPQLVTAFERSAALSDDPEVRAARFASIAEVHESKLDDPAGAARAYERILALKPDDENVLGALARLSEKSGDWRASAAYRARLAEKTADPVLRARAHVALAQLLGAEDKDPLAARGHFEQAVALDTSNETAWKALVWKAREADDHHRVAAYLEQRASMTDAPRLRAQLFAELAEVRANHLDDEAGSLAAYEAALAADPTNEAAARALVELYVATERWEEAAGLQEIAMVAAQRDHDAERELALYRAGRKIASALGYPDLALDAARAAYELRPSSPETQAELILAAEQMQRDARALASVKEALKGIAASHEGLAPESVAKLADLLVACGETAPAYALYDAALKAEPTNRAALSGLAGLYEGDDVVVATALKRHLAKQLEDADEKLALLLECGEALAKAGKLNLALEAYEEARAIRPRDLPLLHVMLGHLTALERWPKVSEVLRALVDADDDTTRKAKRVATMAQLAEEKLGDPAASATLNEEALELDPSRLECFERLVRVLTARRDWIALEQTYQRMLLRILGKGDTKLQHALYHQLGLICRDRLGDAQRALAYFRAAAELRPDDEEVQTILRELLTLTGQVQGAIIVALEQVRKDPLGTAGYPALFDLMLQAAPVDRAWCVASAMNHLGVLGEGQAAALYRAHPPKALLEIFGRLEGDAWRASLLHPELDPRLTAVFELAAPAAISAKLAQMSIRQRIGYPGAALHPGRDPRAALLAAATLHASAIFGLAAPKLYARKGPGPALAAAWTRPPSLVAGIDVIETMPESHLTFFLGKRLFELTPPLLARAVCPTVSELAALLTMAVEGSLRAHMRPAEIAALAAAVDAARADPAALDVARWSLLADLSASRAGLLLVGDVELARAAIAREPQSPGDLPLRDQARELILFSLTDEYARLRRALF